MTYLVNVVFGRAGASKIHKLMQIDAYTFSGILWNFLQNKEKKWNHIKTISRFERKKWRKTIYNIYSFITIDVPTNKLQRITKRIFSLCLFHLNCVPVHYISVLGLSFFNWLLFYCYDKKFTRFCVTHRTTKDINVSYWVTTLVDSLRLVCRCKQFSVVFVLSPRFFFSSVCWFAFQNSKQIFHLCGLLLSLRKEFLKEQTKCTNYEVCTLHTSQRWQN